jgi:uncharacterized protein
MDQRRAVQVEDVVRLIVKGLVDDVNAVMISSVEGKSGVHFVIVAEPDQVGKLIGKNGRTARAFRTLLYLVGQKNHQTYTLDILPMPSDLD